MSIHWRLGVPLPGRLFGEFSILRGAWRRGKRKLAAGAFLQAVAGGG